MELLLLQARGDTTQDLHTVEMLFMFFFSSVYDDDDDDEVIVLCVCVISALQLLHWQHV